MNDTAIIATGHNDEESMNLSIFQIGQKNGTLN